MSASISIPLSLLPGKSDRDSGDLWLPTWLHAMDTAGVAQRLFACWLPQAIRDRLAEEVGEEGASSLIALLALVHDLGKMTPLFVARIAQSLPEIAHKLCAAGLDVPSHSAFRDATRSPHALAGAALLFDAGFPECVVQIVAAHHGQPMSIDDAYNLDIMTATYGQHYFGMKSAQAGAWKAAQREWIRFSLERAGYADIGELPKLSLPSQVVLSGLLIMADWLASNTTYFPLIPVDETGDPSMCDARTVSAWARIRLPDPWSPPCFAMDDFDFEARFGFAPNDVQRAVLHAAQGCVSPGLMILEAQMGVGKTEAALAAAEVFAARCGEGGIFFGLPTQATANGIFTRLVRWAQLQSEDCRHAIRLAHGMAEMNEDYRALFTGESRTQEDEDSGLIVHTWFKGRKQALLANFVIGTVDQLLLAALRQRHLMLRHLGLAGKVVVIDECHAYDAFMNQYLDRVLAWLGAYRVPVVLLSATLPAARREALVRAYAGGQIAHQDEGWATATAYPLLTWTDGGDVHSRAIWQHVPARNVRITRMDDGQLAPFLQDRLACGGCAGVIVNTVIRAQQIGAMLRDALPGFEVRVVHSHFLMTDRAAWEKRLLSDLGRDSTPQRRSRLIVVGTQVLEQSLDIDFDVMVSDLCPMELLLQRIGRLHRHAWRARPEPLLAAQCGVLCAGEGELESGAKTIYGEWLLQRTRALLPAAIALPQDIAPLVQAAYQTPEDEGDLAYAEHLKKRDDMRSRAKNYRIGEPDPGDPIPSLAGWLNTPQAGDERHMEASVRDGDMPIEVLVMVDHGDGRIGFASGGEDRRLSATHVPCEEDARRVAQQRLKLPHVFNYKSREVIAALEERTWARLCAWQESAWLRGELFLLLEANGSARLAGYQLHYDAIEGLTYRKEDDHADA